jgi:hypothetical protein
VSVRHSSTSAPFHQRLLQAYQGVLPFISRAMDSNSATTYEKNGLEIEQHTNVVNIAEVDVAAGLDSDQPLDPEVAARLRCVQLISLLQHKHDHLSSSFMLDVKLTCISCPSCAVRNLNPVGDCSKIELSLFSIVLNSHVPVRTDSLLDIRMLWPHAHTAPTTA